MKNRFGLIVLAGLIVAATAAHGLATGRWTRADQVADLVLPIVPSQIGDWRGEDLKSDLDGDKHLRNLTRRYTHAKTGRSFTMSLTLGPAGLTAQHTPEYCYPGSGYKLADAVKQFVVPGRTETDGSFRTAVFRKDGPSGPDSVRIFWAWTAEGKWTAPKWPELQFLGGSALHKLYVVSSATDQPDADPATGEFLSALVGALHQSLFASPAN